MNKVSARGARYPRQCQAPIPLAAHHCQMEVILNRQTYSVLRSPIHTPQLQLCPCLTPGIRGFTHPESSLTLPRRNSNYDGRMAKRKSLAIFECRVLLARHTVSGAGVDLTPTGYEPSIGVGSGIAAEHGHGF